MKKFLLVSLLSLSMVLLPGCGTLIPKRVELFQKKVQALPEPSAKQKEVQREVAQRAVETAKRTADAAREENASTLVTLPADETVVLTEALAESVGPPLKQSKDDSAALAAELRAQIAQLNKKIDAFQVKNEEVAGKKIEGTGLVSVPYFVWLGGFVLVVVVLWHLGKLALAAASAANPGVAAGSALLSTGETLAANVVKKGFAQVVAGGEEFKTWVEKEITDSGLKQKILGAFVTAQKTVQDADVKSAVNKLTS